MNDPEKWIEDPCIVRGRDTFNDVASEMHQYTFKTKDYGSIVEVPVDKLKDLKRYVSYIYNGDGPEKVVITDRVLGLKIVPVESGGIIKVRGDNDNQ